MKETKQFETESKELLNLMVNSIYSNHEVFLRELISNASDAIDKYRFLSMNSKGEIPLDAGQIRISVDKKKRTWKMLVSAFVAALMAAAFIIALPGKNVSAIDGSCDIENSSNIDANSYLTYADVVKSYLHLLNNGNIMKVQYQEAGTATSAVPELLIQYYDKDYKFINSKVVQCDLPLFGGFYGTSTNYYILSGQKNPDEDNAK